LQFLSAHWLDIIGTLIGLVYVWQEYRASMWLWITGLIMPLVYMVVYYRAGLYADFGMQVNALSFIALWWLARKYLEQWLLWIVVDTELAALYVYKGLPFTAGLYTLYVIIAIAGYRKWKGMMRGAASAPDGQDKDNGNGTL
jgi:nicotinamide riboside transporter PnuC